MARFGCWPEKARRFSRPVAAISFSQAPPKGPKISGMVWVPMQRSRWQMAVKRLRRQTSKIKPQPLMARLSINHGLIFRVERLISRIMPLFNPNLAKSTLRRRITPPSLWLRVLRIKVRSRLIQGQRLMFQGLRTSSSPCLGMS